EGLEDRAGLVAAMHHAVRATRVTAGAVGLPVGALVEVAQAADVAVGEQVTGAAPALDRVGRHRPGRAAVLALALEELVEERVVVEGHLEVAAALVDLGVEVLGLAAG